MAELKVTKVEKGDRFKVGELAHVRYVTARWVGKGAAPPGATDGSFQFEAKVGDAVRAFLAKDEEGGFRPLLPNGIEVSGATKSK